MTPLTQTVDYYGQSITTSWTPPDGLKISTADGDMSPDRMDVSWILGPRDRGPERGKVTCWGRSKAGPASHAYWGYGGVMADSPAWAQSLASLAYREAAGEGAAGAPGFVLTASARSRWLERRFTLSEAPDVPSYLNPADRFAPASGMIWWSLGSGEPDSSSLWLWGTGMQESATYRNADTIPDWLQDDHAAARSALDAAAPPPGWETHQPLIRPERIRRGAS